MGQGEVAGVRCRARALCGRDLFQHRRRAERSGGDWRPRGGRRDDREGLCGCRCERCLWLRNTLRLPRHRPSRRPSHCRSACMEALTADGHTQVGRPLAYGTAMSDRVGLDAIERLEVDRNPLGDQAAEKA